MKISRKVWNIKPNVRASPLKKLWKVIDKTCCTNMNSFSSYESDLMFTVIHRCWRHFSGCIGSKNNIKVKEGSENRTYFCILIGEKMQPKLRTNRRDDLPRRTVMFCVRSHKLWINIMYHKGIAKNEYINPLRRKCVMCCSSNRQNKFILLPHHRILENLKNATLLK